MTIGWYFETKYKKGKEIAMNDEFEYKSLDRDNNNFDELLFEYLSEGWVVFGCDSEDVWYVYLRRPVHYERKAYTVVDLDDLEDFLDNELDDKGREWHEIGRQAHESWKFTDVYLMRYLEPGEVIEY